MNTWTLTMVDRSIITQQWQYNMTYVGIRRLIRIELLCRSNADWILYTCQIIFSNHILYIGDKILLNHFTLDLGSMQATQNIILSYDSEHASIIQLVIDCSSTDYIMICHNNTPMIKKNSTVLPMVQHTVYPKKYAHGLCFAVLCCGNTLTDFPISIRLISLALWQSNDCPSASKVTLMNMDKYFMWIHYERLHNHNKSKHNKTVCIFLGIYCTLAVGDIRPSGTSLVSSHSKQPWQSVGLHLKLLWLY